MLPENQASQVLPLPHLDADRLEECSHAIRLCRSAVVETIQPLGIGDGRNPGAINIPFYEEMVQSINWRTFHDCRMLPYTPYYISLGKFGIAILLTLLAKRVSHGLGRLHTLALSTKMTPL